MRTLLVVDEDEAVDLGLELGQGRCGRLLAQPLLEGEVVALDSTHNHGAAIGARDKVLCRGC